MLFRKDSIIYYILSIYFIFGLFIYKDFGVGIEEHFQRSSGFYWLQYILEFTDFEIIKEQVNQKILEINNLHPNLPPFEIAKHYGIIFDLPMAFLEIIFNVNKSSDQFYLRHISNFIVFFISGYLFFLLIKERVKINFIAILACLFYLLSPRIFGNSFFDAKDLLFLSLVTITFYFYLNYSKKKNLNTLFLFALFAAISTSTRIMGLFFPISFFLISIFEIVNKKYNRRIIRDLLVFFLLFILCLYIHWPYLWSIEIKEFTNFFQNFKVGSNPDVFFNGVFFNSKYLPFSYIPLWILISVPEIIILFFFIGFIFFSKRLFKRLILIKENSIFNDLWRGNLEKTDLFIFLSFFQIIIIYTSFDLSLYSGWRHFIFLNFFITYFAITGIYILYFKFKNNRNIKKFFIILLYIGIIEIIFNLYKYHPFQSVYFNNLISNEIINKFEIDTQSISRTMAIRDILNDANHGKTITIATASWTPLENGRSLLSHVDQDRLKFIGTNNKQQADYIYSNFYYETNPKYVKKYKIPANFKLLKSLTVDNTIVYSIYKKIK